MKCIFCKICEERISILNRKQIEWFAALSDNRAFVECEADAQRLSRAYDLLKIDPTKSFESFLTLAESGSVWSMAMIGKLFEDGEGTKRDLVQAEAWYTRAYQAGSDYGLIWLGLFYMHTNRLKDAVDVFGAGVERGFAPAMYYLAWAYWKSNNWPEKRDEAMSLLQRGFAAGDLGAGRFLTYSMIRGRFGLKHVMAGFRLVNKIANDEAKVIEDYKVTMEGSGNKRPGLFSRLAASLWTASQTRISSTAGVGGTRVLQTGS
jgi:hypothetical protein